MTWAQFMDWVRYDAMHPIGDLRSEIEFARLKCLVAQVVADNKLTPRDFMWSFMTDQKQDAVEPEQRGTQKVKQMFGVG